MLLRHAGQTLQEFHEEINLYFKNKLWCCLNFGPDSEPRLKVQEEICGILKETTDFSRTRTDLFQPLILMLDVDSPQPPPPPVCHPYPTTTLSLIPSPSCLHETMIRNIQMFLHSMGNFILTCSLSPGDIVLGHSLISCSWPDNHHPSPANSYLPTKS